MRWAIIFLFAGGLLLPGCVRRTLSISSEPQGALVWLNEREVGRTPLDVDFTYHGRYDVRLVKEGYEPLLTSGMAPPPLWEVVPPLDLIAEMVPGNPHSRIRWHYVLLPRNDDQQSLLGRADEFRSQLVPAPPAATAPASQPAAAPQQPLAASRGLSRR